MIREDCINRILEGCVFCLFNCYGMKITRLSHSHFSENRWSLSYRMLNLSKWGLRPHGHDYSMCTDPYSGTWTALLLVCNTDCVKCFYEAWYSLCKAMLAMANTSVHCMLFHLPQALFLLMKKKCVPIVSVKIGDTRKYSISPISKFYLRIHVTCAPEALVYNRTGGMARWQGVQTYCTLNHTLMVFHPGKM